MVFWKPDKNILKRIDYRCFIGIALLAAGIVLFVLSIHATKKIADANTLSQSISDYFEHNPTWNPIVKFFGGKAQEKIDYYSNRVLMIQIGSIVLTALGAAIIVIFRKKKNP